MLKRRPAWHYEKYEKYDLVADEGRYHKSCRSSFENSVPEHHCKGIPPNSRLKFSEKRANNKKNGTVYCEKVLNTIIYGSDNAYSTKSFKVRFMHKYCDDKQFVMR